MLQDSDWDSSDSKAPNVDVQVRNDDDVIDVDKINVYDDDHDDDRGGMVVELWHGCEAVTVMMSVTLMEMTVVMVMTKMMTMVAVVVTVMVTSLMVERLSKDADGEGLHDVDAAEGDTTRVGAMTPAMMRSCLLSLSIMFGAVVVVVDVDYDGCHYDDCCCYCR